MCTYICVQMFRFICVFLILLSASRAEEDLLVSIEDGLVEGTYKTSYDGRKFAAFEGIPYAAPPIQKYRFKDPQPVQKWNGTLKASITYSCIQRSFIGGSIFGSEDCLYINVYVPRERINPDEELDVVVHIHGGAFMLGSGQLAGPSKIMDRDLVYVNFNYRLGPFGFMATEDDVFAGNFGMKDQVQALKWVQRNIKQFGGNPKSVTLTGLSAGGASVHLHYFALTTEEELFHRGWTQSGSAFNPWAARRSAWPAAKKFIERLGCTDESIKVTLRCMRQRPALQLVEGLDAVYVDEMLPVAPFAPVMELLSQNNQEPFMIAHPYIQLRSGYCLNKPLIISQTTDEGIFPAYLYYNRLDELNEKFDTYAPYLFEYYDATEEKQAEATKQIKEFYFKNEPITRDNFSSFVKALSHRIFHMGAEKSARLQANASSENVYFLLFGYPGENSQTLQIGIEGVSHGFDAGFLYDVNMFETDPTRLTKEEERMKDIYLDMLVSYAKTGVPTLEGVEWEPVSMEGNLKYLSIKSPDDIQMKSRKRLAAHEFWKSLELLEDENAYHFKGSTIEIM